MNFIPTALQGSYTIELEPFSDHRGWFARTFCKKEFEKIGHQKEWLQMNHSFTQQKGAIRGMHFQYPPFGEIKLIRCIAGSVFDVIIDLRKNSPTFLKWYGVELSAENKRMIYVPEGFAHGFQTLANDSELIYHHTEFYTKGSESGIYFQDPMIGINWPLAVTDISDRDKNHPLLDNNFKGL